MARRNSNYTGSPAKQVHRRARSSNHCSPAPQHGLGRQAAQQQATHAKPNQNKTFINLVQTIEQQATVNEALHDNFRKEKASSALLGTLMHQSRAKAGEYKLALGTVGAELQTTKQTLQYATEQLQGSQDELQQAEECIQAQGSQLQEQAYKIFNLEASIEALTEQTEALGRSNGFLNKQLTWERADNKKLVKELQDCEFKLAAVEAKSNKLAQHNEQLKAAVAGDYTAVLSTALAGGFEDSMLFWLVMVLMSAIVQASVLLHILMLTTLFSMLSKGLVAAPHLLREARVCATVLWGLVCDLLGCLRAGVGGCAGLLHSSITSTKTLVCCTHSSTLQVWASSSERLLRRLSSWGSTCVTSTEATPVSSGRASIRDDAADDSALDGAAAEVFVVVSLKQGMLAKDTDI